MLVETSEEYNRVLELLQEEPIIAIDTETNGLQPYHGNQIIGVSLYFPNAKEGYYLPFRHEKGNNLPIECLEDLRRYYPVLGKTYVGHNIKFDLHMLNVDGFSRPDQVEDTMLAAHILNENEPTFALKKLAVKYLGAWAGEGETDLQQQAEALGLGAKTQMASIPASLVSKYAELDTKITWELREFYRPALDRWNQWDFYQQHNEYLLKFLFEAEKNGLYINADTIKQNVAIIESKLPGILQNLKEEARLTGNSDFNPNSPSQTLDFLRAKGYDLPSTGADCLEPYNRAGDVWPQQILAYRRLSKLKNGFYTPYESLRDSYGFVHTTYHAAGPVTGRLSSSDPNLQQVPRKAGKTEMKEKNDVKAIFEARPGYVLVVSDYSQLELRLAIHFANQYTMKEMILQGLDLHQYTADNLTYMLGYEISRDIGKRSNFGLLYRMGGEKAALKFGIPVQMADELVEGWRNLYPEFGRAYYAYMNRATEWRDADGSKNGKYQFIRLYNARIKHFHEATRRGESATYKAWNFVVQGTAAAITEESALRISRIFDGDSRVLPVLTVHDSLGWEIEESFIDEFVSVMIHEMTDYPDFSVPLEIDTQVGYNWRDMISYEGWKNGQ